MDKKKKVVRGIEGLEGERLQEGKKCVCVCVGGGGQKRREREKEKGMGYKRE